MMSAHRTRLENLGEQLRIKNSENWYYYFLIFDRVRYKVKLSPEQKNEYADLLASYENSLPLALTKLFPEHNWLPWKFNPIPPWNLG